MIPWTVKYRPKKIEDIQGHKKSISDILHLIEKKDKAILIYGSPGNGKTSTVYAISDFLDLELIEVNASDVRDRESINKRLGAAIAQQSLFQKGKLILVDELDGISGTSDRGGLSELSKLIEESKYPIVMTANNPWEPKFSTLRKKAHLVEFRTLAYPSVVSVLKNICAAENIACDESALTTLARRSAGDLRGAINDLQTLSDFTGKLTTTDVDELTGRSQTESVVNAIMRILKTTNPEVALEAMNNIEEDTDDIFLWLEENIPHEYKNAKDLAKAFDNLSKADIFRGRIRRWQYWRFLVYINSLLTAGVALSKEQKYTGFSKYQRPTRILNMWQFNQKNSLRKSIASKIGEKTHTSTKRAITDVLPYIQTIYKNNQTRAAEFTEYFEFEKEEVAYLIK